MFALLSYNFPSLEDGLRKTVVSVGFKLLLCR